MALFASADLAGQVRVPLAAADGEAFPERFSLLKGARELADGRVLVADWIEERVTALDFGTGMSTEVASRGDGPAEYRLPEGLMRYRGDSTVLIDRGNSRLAVIGPTGAIHRTVRATLPGAAVPGGVDGRGRFYYVQPGYAIGEPPGSTSPRPLVRWDPATGAVEEIARVDVARPRPDAGGARMTPGIPFVPFAAIDGWAVDETGAVAIVRRDPFVVEWRAEGRVVRGPPRPADAEPVTAADREAFVRRFLERSPISGRGPDGGLGQTPPASDREVREMVETNAFAAAHAPFDPAGVRIAPDGRLWVKRTPATRTPDMFDVFDRNGSLVAQVELPSGRELVGIGERHVYAVWRDELGLETLERYPVALGT